MSRLEWMHVVFITVCPFISFAFDPSEEFLLATDSQNGIVVVFDLNGKVVETFDVGAGGYTSPQTVEFDYVRQRVYFTNPRHGIISMNVDGGDLTHHASPMLSHGVSIDSSTNTLYWADSESAESLSKMSLCEGGTEQVLITDENQIWGLEVYKGYAYYSVSSGETAKIAKIPVEPEGIAPTNLLTYPDVDSPNGIYLDREEEKLYWADESYEHIGRVSLDGTDFEILQEGLPGDLIRDVVVTPLTIMWVASSNEIFALRRDDYDSPVEIFADYAGTLNSIHYQNRGLHCVVENPTIVTGEASVVYGSPNYPGIDVCFRKSGGTGASASLPPSILRDVSEPFWGKSLTLPDPPQWPARRLGVYSCAFSGGPVDATIRAGIASRGKDLMNGTCRSNRRNNCITFPALSPADGRFTKTASVKDKVTIAVKKPNGGCFTRLVRWRRDGNVVSQWSGRTHVTIKEATIKDEGTYEVYLRGRRARNKQTTILLYIRACEEGTFGVECSETCVCKNGGHCDAITGSCICPPGFRGGTCEEIDSTARPYCAKVFGPEHAKCQGLLFCLRGKFGCTCAAGYHGPDCHGKCRPGTYGAGCTQKCPRGECCDRFGPAFTCP